MRFMRIIILSMFVHIFLFISSCTQTAGEAPQSVKDTFMPEGDRVTVKAWVENLEIPWSLVFLPDGRALVSERPGRIRLIQNGKLEARPYAQLEVAHVGEGGLMGLALHPEFPRKSYVYAMHTYRKGNDLYNKVVRLSDKGKTGIIDRVIIDKIPGGRFHNGGRIVFGPDGLLYIATGETFNGELAQNLESLGGKILRVSAEGEIPRDNPFEGSHVYSYGHRNPQGLAWQPGTGRLFESEHGPSGESGRFGHDEINIILKGENYGWPEVIGAPDMRPYKDPIIAWKKTTPPSGITFYRGNLMKHLENDLFVATLKSESLIRIQFDTDGTTVKLIERWFSSGFTSGKYGRIRDVVEGPDGALYFLTSNRDGRGDPRPGDDKIYRITPE